MKMKMTKKQVNAVKKVMAMIGKKFYTSDFGNKESLFRNPLVRYRKSTCAMLTMLIDMCNTLFYGTRYEGISADLSSYSSLEELKKSYAVVNTNIVSLVKLIEMNVVTLELLQAMREIIVDILNNGQMSIDIAKKNNTVYVKFFYDYFETWGNLYLNVDTLQVIVKEAK